MRAESSANSDAATRTLSTTEWLRRSQQTPARAYRRQTQVGAEPTHHRPETNRSYEAFLRSASAEALAEQCEALAQEMGLTEPYSDDEKRLLLRTAHQRHLEQRRNRRQAQRLDVYNRRRARKRDATIEHFTRDEIIERDHSTCHLCGKLCEPEEIHLDHVIPLSKGGEHSRANVKVACADCNIHKGASMPSDTTRYTPRA